MGTYYCMQCGKPIAVREGKARAFCSYECYWEWRRHNMDMLALPSQHITKICEVCGNSFGVHRYRANVARYCSVKCMHEARRKYPVSPGFKPKPCACGCGGIVEPQFHHKYYGMSQYLPGHGNFLPERIPYETPFQGVKYMRSHWEVLYADWLTFSGEPWYYECKVFNLGDTTYLPDFYLADKNEWHEIKGYPREKGMEKIRRFRDLYPNERLVVIGRKEMKAIMLALQEVSSNVLKSSRLGSA